VISVSATSRWFVRDTRPMRRLHWIVMTRPGRWIARRVFAVRIDAAGWVPVPATPVELVGRLAPIPLLIVHGDQDSYLTMEHPRALAAAAGRPAELWEVVGFGHAEHGADDALLDRIGEHLPVLLARGEREPVAGCQSP
jgi:pimeloyl-ACP methyl ester carboxylesterase